MNDDDRYERLESVELSLFRLFTTGERPTILSSLIDRERTEICAADSPVDCYAELDLDSRINVDCRVFQRDQPRRQSPLDENITEILARQFGDASPIVDKDFADAMFHQLAGRVPEDESWTDHWVRGLRCMVAQIAPDGYHSYGRRTFNFGPFADEPHEGSRNFENLLWEHEQNFQLVFEFGPLDGVKEFLPFGPWCSAQARIKAFASETAIARMEDFLCEWIKTIVQIIRFSATSTERRKRNASNKLSDFWDQAIEDAGVLAGHLCTSDSRAVAKVCLGGLVRAKATLEGTLQRRLMNALTLFQEASKQTLPGVGLTLCFSAMEAMVNEDAAGVLNQVSQRVPALLSQDIGRRADATRAIKNLYQVRSNLAHGAEVQAAPELFRMARKLTAGVIRAACCWINNAASYEDNDPKWKDFVTDLIDAERKDQCVNGVPELSDLFPRNSDVKARMPK